MSDGYTQLNLIDMFRRVRGGNNSNSSPGGRGRGNSENGRPQESGSRGRGVVRNRDSRDNSSSRYSNSPGSGSRHRGGGGGSSRGGGGGYRLRGSNRDRGGDRNNRGRGHRLNGNETEEGEGEEEVSDAMDVDVGVTVPFPQGTSTMLRAGRASSGALNKLNTAHAVIIQAESPIVSTALFGQKALGYMYNAVDIKPLGQNYCPNYRLPPEDPQAGQIGCRIKVVNQDTFTCAEEMVKRHNFEQSQMLIARNQGNAEPDLHPVDNGVVCLNMANAHSKGGGFTSGSSAQEEALMHRSTLWATLDQAFYPWTDTEGVYSPYVAVYKKYNPGDPANPGDAGSYTALERAEAILNAKPPPTKANQIALPGPPLSEVAVISIAAISRPATTTAADGTEDYTDPYVRDLMYLKVRQMLRIAALNGHRRLVLGALGCGAFRNPKQRVAEIFLSVLQEAEFQGGWWKEITFACFDRDTSPASNPYIFGKVLGGQVV
ncbi:hypothetical protein AOL_s00006g145 [Orbilia oligospora ATCC 24927]|uniref:Microbial-type PARG catalytic domain-containing protein n=2 Tax=Orbilia oligospora TaxID=2813651 RepID=G1WZU4_ARTOA|nr:hypothetical protein AOL_s00006g145 [Orbilia oligospora ATCC 24927]EGX53279.1 hypothetical protein AOL_s00006g145 [Orbilia oligospora ATCC 24927]